MAPLRISRKKNVAKRAWMSLTNMLKSQFKGIQIATSVKDFTSRLLHVFSRRLIVPFKTSYLQNTIPRARFNNYYSHSHSPRKRSRFLECVSRLFAKKKCLRRHNSERNYRNSSEYQGQLWRERAIRSEEKVLGRKKEEEGVEEIVDSLEDAWRIVVGASPHLLVHDVTCN